MNRYEHSIEIECPVEEVFAFISEVENYPRWQPSMLEVRRRAKGPLRVGSEVTEVRRFLGREMETTWVCTEHEHGRRSSIESDEGAVPFKGIFELEPLGDRTLFTWVVETSGPRGIKVPGAIVGRMVRHELEANCERLKELLEGGGEGSRSGVWSAA